MRTLSSALSTHLSERSHSRCKMLLLDLKDGTSIGITDHDKDIDFDIGDGVVTYGAGTGILASNVAMSCGLDADNYEVTGPIADVVTLDAIVGGRFNRALARLFEVNWKQLSAGAIKLLAGNVTEARVEGGKFVLEIRSHVDRYNQTVGRVITDQCDADFADQIQCFATATEIVGTVTAVASSLQFTVSYGGGPYADAFFNKGTVISSTPETVEIETWDDHGDGTATITLFSPLATALAIGDTPTIRDGCGKSRADCMAHNAIEWFRGYPEVPGRRALMPAIPGQ